MEVLTTSHVMPLWNWEMEKQGRVKRSKISQKSPSIAFIPRHPILFRRWSPWDAPPWCAAPWSRTPRAPSGPPQWAAPPSPPRHGGGSHRFAQRSAAGRRASRVASHATRPSTPCFATLPRLEGTYKIFKSSIVLGDLILLWVFWNLSQPHPWRRLVYRSSDRAAWLSVSDMWLPLESPQNDPAHWILSTPQLQITINNPRSQWHVRNQKPPQAWGQRSQSNGGIGRCQRRSEWQPDGIQHMNGFMCFYRVDAAEHACKLMFISLERFGEEVLLPNGWNRHTPTTSTTNSQNPLT